MPHDPTQTLLPRTQPPRPPRVLVRLEDPRESHAFALVTVRANDSRILHDAYQLAGLGIKQGLGIDEVIVSWPNARVLVLPDDPMTSFRAHNVNAVRLHDPERLTCRNASATDSCLLHVCPLGFYVSLFATTPEPCALVTRMIPWALVPHVLESPGATHFPRPSAGLFLAPPSSPGTTRHAKGHRR